MNYYAHIECINLSKTLLNYKGCSKITNGKNDLMFGKKFNNLKEAQVYKNNILKDDKVIHSSIWKN